MAVRKPLIAGNWKMNGTRAAVRTLIEGIKAGAKTLNDVDILVLPTYLHLAEVYQLIENTQIHLGAQDLYLGTTGAFTGEVSGPLLADVGCEYVLIGHSERRTLFKEDLAMVAAKFKAAKQANLIPILCVGESQKEREKGETERVIRLQLDSVVESVGIDAFQKAVIAYEPVWAIGTGLTATPAQAQAVHAFIRARLAQNNVDIAGAIRILYGGSMKPDNAASLLAMADIDGGLIGGASLDAGNFIQICKAAETAIEV